MPEQPVRRVGQKDEKPTCPSRIEGDLDTDDLDDVLRVALIQLVVRGTDHNPIIDPDITEKARALVREENETRPDKPIEPKPE